MRAKKDEPDETNLILGRAIEPTPGGGVRLVIDIPPPPPLPPGFTLTGSQTVICRGRTDFDTPPRPVPLAVAVREWLAELNEVGPVTLAADGRHPGGEPMTLRTSYDFELGEWDPWY